MKLSRLRRITAALILIASSLSSQFAFAHGGVAFEEDLCVINIDFLQAHFTVFQPETREFRIIRDINEVGRYATLDDVLAIEDLEAATVYYEPRRIEEGGFYTASYEFDSKGTYIGVVTAEHPVEDRYYTAVFYFQVGGPDYGNLPLFLAIALLLQTGYWFSNGGWAKRKARLAAKKQDTEL